MRKTLGSVHPGEILGEELMNPTGISIDRRARYQEEPPGRSSGIFSGKPETKANTSPRLARLFRAAPDVWLGLQAEHDMRLAKRTVGQETERIRPYAAAAA